MTNTSDSCVKTEPRKIYQKKIKRSTELKRRKIKWGNKRKLKIVGKVKYIENGLRKDLQYRWEISTINEI